MGIYRALFTYGDGAGKTMVHKKVFYAETENATGNLIQCTSDAGGAGFCEGLFGGQVINGSCVPRSLHVGDSHPGVYPASGLELANGDLVVQFGLL